MRLLRIHYKLFVPVSIYDFFLKTNNEYVSFLLQVETKI